MSKQKILIVDDDQDYLIQMRIRVESFGFEVFTADNQDEAEKAMAEVVPDLVILDLMMENEDSGFILCRKFKASNPDIPVILATAVAAETGISFGLNSEEERKWIKADLIMEKGIRTDQLHKEIMRLLKIEE